MISKLNHFLLDSLWCFPDVRIIRLCLALLPPSPYKQALIQDVLYDDPHHALSILRPFSSSPDFRHRLDYLNLRTGKFKNNRTYPQIAQGTKGAVTPTTTLIRITKLHGVHPHFGELENLIRKHQLKSGAEIGVFMGYHAAHLLEACRNLTLYCVDLYDNIAGNGYDDWDKSQFDQLFNKVKRELGRFHRAVFVRKLSLDAAAAFPPHTLDFIFLDADHRYQAVKKDLPAWEKIVKPGGVISGHDYNHPEWPGVKQAVDEWASSTHRKIHQGRETFWYTFA